MPTRNVVITQHQADLVESLVTSGRYQNASEVLREGLRLVEERERREAKKLEALREAARVGFEALDRGEYKEFASASELADYLDVISEEVLRELHDLWVRRDRRDPYIGTLVNAWIEEGGRATAVRAGSTYVDVGTVEGYREALGVLGLAAELPDPGRQNVPAHVP